MGMTNERNGTAVLAELVEFADREDWLYQAELSLAAEFSAVAKAFAEANPGSDVICANYIGPESALRYSARSCMLRSIKSIDRSLNELEGIRPAYQPNKQWSDYLSPTSPAQSFLRAELIKRNLDKAGDNIGGNPTFSHGITRQGYQDQDSCPP